MSHLMPGEKLEEQLPRLIPGILTLYKKHAEAFYISKVSLAKDLSPAPLQSLLLLSSSLLAPPELHSHLELSSWWAS